MYQSNLAKDLKKHKKSFPLNLKFTTDFNSLTELFASGMLVVLLMSAGQLGSQIHDHWVYLYWNSIVSSKVCYWTWLFHSNGLWTFWVQDILLMMFFQNTFIIKKVTMPAVTIQLYEQRLNFFNVWSYHWHQVFLIDQHSFHLFVTTQWYFLEPHLPIVSLHGSDSLT